MLAILITAFLILGTGRGLEWSHRLREAAGPVELCSGQNIQLFWNFTLSKEERLKGMVWGCDLEGLEEGSMLATFTDGYFVPMSHFSGRLSHKQNAGIELSCATILESGNYSVAVSVEDVETNAIVVHHKSASVLVLDMPKTVNGDLHLSMDREAVRDVISGEWHVQLSCGNFSDRGHPEVEVIWTTPTGQQVSSSNYSDGFFRLLLENPVKGGNYSCSLIPEQTALTCLDKDADLRQPAFMTVEENAARLTLVEARQQEILDKLIANDGHVAQLESGQRDTLDRLTTESSRWTRQVENLSHNTSALELRLDAALQKSAPVSFHARLSSDTSMSNGYILELDDVISNQGQGYDPFTGVFTAPRNGTYFFIGTTGSYSSSSWANMRLVMDGTTIADTYLYLYSSYYSMGSCHAVMAMTAGDSVWLESSISNSYFDNLVTSFTGFQIS